MYRVLTDKDLRGEGVCGYQTEKTKNNSFCLSMLKAGDQRLLHKSLILSALEG